MAMGTVKGNGNLKKESRDISAFTALSSAGQFSVEIGYGSGDQLQIEGDENILPYIETYVKDGTLKLKVKDLTIIKPQLQIRIKISMATITGISVSGSGEIDGHGDFFNDGNTSFSMSGSGKLKLGFNHFSNVNISMSGSGTIELKGAVSKDLDIHQSGSGRIDCEGMPCENATVKISGSGNVRVNANQYISAHISGSGEILYAGSAGRLDSHISGSGKIRKI